MNIEYISRKISSILWLPEDCLRRSNHPSERFWVCGTYGSPSKNSLSIWTNFNGSSELSSTGIYQMDNLKYVVGEDVVEIISFEGNSLLVGLANDDIVWLKYSSIDGFELVHKWTSNEEKSLSQHEMSGLLKSENKDLVTFGLDGKLNFFDLTTKKLVQSSTITSNSIHCADNISPTQIVCGTTSGHLKVYDTRSQQVEINMVDQLSAITAVCPYVSSVISCGNQFGSLSLWDIRNPNHRPMQPAQAHFEAITCLRSSSKLSDSLFTSSIDGQLIKWGITNNFEINSVEPIIDKNNTFPINCFDVNADNQLVFADDNEVLYLTVL